MQLTRGNTGLKIRAVIECENPEKTAQAFQLTLALDKGYTSKIVRGEGPDRLVVASDNQAVRFVRR